MDYFFDGETGSAAGGSESGDGRGCAAPKKKDPNRTNQLEPSLPLLTDKMAEIVGRPKTLVPFSFPNIAHNVWDNYRLTGQYHLRQSKLSPPPK